MIGGRRRVRRDGVQGVEDGYDELVMGRSLDGGGEGGPLGLEERERLCTTSHTLTARDSCTLRKSYPLNLAKNFCRMRQSVPRRTSPRVHIITYRPPFFLLTPTAPYPAAAADRSHAHAATLHARGARTMPRRTDRRLRSETERAGADARRRRRRRER